MKFGHFDPWIWDPGWVESQHPDPGWTTRIIFSRASKPFFWLFWGLKYWNSLMRIRDPGWRQIGSGMEKIRIRDKHPGSATLFFWVMRPRNKPPDSSDPQTSDEIYTCTKSYGAMNANDPTISQPITCKLSCKNRNSDQIVPWKCFNCLKLSFFVLKIRLLFTDLIRIRFRIRIRIRIRNDYFGSWSDPDPAKSFGSLRIWFRIRIRNTGLLDHIGTDRDPRIHTYD